MALLCVAAGWMVLAAGCGGGGADDGGKPTEQPGGQPPPVPGDTRTWSEATVLAEAGELVARGTKVAANARGDAVVAWTLAGDGSVWVRRHSASGGWQPPERIFERLGGGPGAIDVDVAIDPDGNSVATWLSRATVLSVWASRSNAGGAWSPAEEVSGIGGVGLSGPDVEMDAQGRALVVWRETDGAHQDIRFNHHDGTDGWSGAGLVASNANLLVVDPALAMHAGGSAIVAWGHHAAAGGAWTLSSARFDPATGWTAPESVPISASGDAAAAAIENVIVRAGPAGRAMVAWLKPAGGRFEAWVNEHDGTGWGTPLGISSGATSKYVYEADLAFDASGTAVLAWTQDGLEAPKEAWVSRRLPAGGWTSPRRLGGPGVASTLSARVALDGHGGAVLAWTQDGAPSDLWAARWRHDAEITDVRRLEDADGDASGPAIAMDGAGRALAVWIQEHATRVGFSNVFGATLR